MRFEVDNSSEIFGSKTSIADLAIWMKPVPDHSVFYEIYKAEYRHEIKSSQIFEHDRFILTFKAGSKLTVHK